MSAAAPWSVKGIDPKAREIAKDLARRSGMTLGDWLNRMIEDSAGGGEGGETPPFAAEELERLRQTLNRLDTKVEAALQELEQGQQQIEERLVRVELGERPDQRLEQLAQELSHNFEAARKELSAQVAAAEQRSSRAMDRLGHEVLRVAEVVGRRMEGVESRLTRTDQAQADSLERIGAEIARITERLAERVAAAERRSAQGLDDVGDQISRVTERLNERTERVSTDLAERIRQSEERTARLLEEAREKIDRRLASGEKTLSEHSDAPSPAPVRFDLAAYAEADLAPGPFGETPAADPEESLFDEGSEPPRFARRGDAPAGFVPPVESLPPEAERSPFETDDFDVASMFRPFDVEETPPETHGEAQAMAGPEAVPEAEPAPEAEVLVEPETAAEPEMAAEREMPTEPEIAEAESAVEAQFAIEPEARGEVDEDIEASGQDLGELDLSQQAGPFVAEPLPEPEPFDPPPRLSTRELIEQARAAARAASEDEAQRRRRGLFGLRSSRGERRPGRLKGGVMISAAAAALGITTAGLTLYSAQEVEHPRSHEPADAAPATATAGPALAAPQAAVALAPHLGQATPAPGSAIDLPGLYADAVRRIESRQPGGVAGLRRGANLGYAPAQFYLAKLYETGDGGLAKDPVAARLWTQRAAEGGESKAMHNLGLYYFEGEGGPKSLVLAAQWFRKAADLGLVDSQYNLARLYEGGFGVPQSEADAFKWYLIAGKSGDAESRAAAARLKPLLPAQVVSQAEAFAASFRPTSAAVTVRTALR